MKLFKIIMNSVITTILIISITLNVLLLCGFQFTKDTSEMDIPSTSKPATIETTSIDTIDTNAEFVSQDTTKATYNESAEDTNEEVIYQDDNIKVKYLQSTDAPAGTEHNFEIENKSSKTLTIVFTDLYVNGHPVYSSGLTCEKLLPGTTTVEEMVLLDKEASVSTTDEHTVSFIIKLVNAKSCLDLYDSERINIKF
jgi:hypothetical protein